MAEKFQIPYVVSPRGMLVKSLIEKKSKCLKYAWIKIFEKHTLRNAHAIHLTSETEKTEIEKFCFDMPALKVIPNGVEIDNNLPYEPSEHLKDKLTAVKGSVIILYLGRINWEKGIDRLIRALGHCRQGCLLVAGNDEEGLTPTLKKIADDIRVSSRVVFVGGVNDLEKKYLIEQAGVLVLPSYSENFGIVVLEAMMRKCPVVVTKEVGIADVVDKYECGIVSDGDPEKLGAAIEKVLSDDGKAHEMGRRGYEAVESNFAWRMIAKQMTIVYKDIIQRSGASA